MMLRVVAIRNVCVAEGWLFVVVGFAFEDSEGAV